MLRSRNAAGRQAEWLLSREHGRDSHVHADVGRTDNNISMGQYHGKAKQEKASYGSMAS